MRPSIARTSQLSRACEATSRRIVCTPRSSPASSLVLCQSCQSRITPRKQNTAFPCQRWISSSSSNSSIRLRSTLSSPDPETIATTRQPETHYDLFPKTLCAGPPPAGPFAIDARALRNEYLRLQAQYHPDVQSSAPQAQAAGTSALINEAYKTLLNPLLRSQYLLSLRGLEVGEDAKEADPELLGEVLEARESIEEAEEESELEDLRRTNEERIRESEAILERCFAEDDLGCARREAVRLRYWVNIQESLNAWEKGKPVVLVH